MPRKIGVVEDSVTIRTAFELTFGGDDLGIDVRTFAAADDIERSADKFDLLIVDGKLGPARDGYAVCAKLRGLPQFASTPVAILVGPTDSYDEAKGKASGAVGGLAKPWESDDMIGKTQALMSAAPPAVAAAAPIAAPAAPARPAAAPAPPARPAPVLPGRPPVSPGAAPIGRPAPAASPVAAVRPASPAVARPAAPAAAKPAAPPPPPPPPAETLDLEDEVEMEVVPEVPPPPPPPASEPAKPAPAAGEFTRGTLADLAQMDNLGQPIQPNMEGAIPLVEERVAREVAAKVPGVTPEQAVAVAKIAREVIEQVAWEVVPDLAEAIIKEQLRALLKE